MRTRAAVALQAGQPLEVMDVDLDGPQPGEVLERRREVEVRGQRRALTRLDARADDEQRHVRVGVVRRALAGVQPVLSEVEPVVRGEHHERVVIDGVEDPAQHPVDRLHHLRPGA